MDMDSKIFRAMRLFHLQKSYPDFLKHLNRDDLLDSYLNDFILQCQEIVKRHREWFFSELHNGLRADTLSPEVCNEYHATLNSKIVHLATAPPQIE